MTRRSMSCFEEAGEWRSFWSQPKNQILQAEMTEHLKAKPGEQTLGRRGYRNVSAKADHPCHAIELGVPRDRDGEFQTALFQRYQRSEKVPC
ncbi:transposase-like protein [Salinibacter ruber]|uniref:Transposase-like protein n=2 Tax=Salinibacter ruber TaxID=146919 RepID=A0A9X2PL96_9BACT|nr:transposase-like protein [Salinibacter ruber]MCS3638700.1 transposase-like protein [Salinibacter ruber]MCS3715257.1 transposase-like protein [Salinibacter ruber]MCS3827837.1 transposase-like protein [Salinibacter ruber]MCS4122407.1 transposase-like protein [Salinibacter ruber]